MVERHVFFYETTPSHIVCTLSFLFPFFPFFSLSLCLSSHVRGDKWRERKGGKEKKKKPTYFFCFAGKERFMLPPHGGSASLFS